MAAMTEVCTGCYVNLEDRHQTQRALGTEPGKRGRMSRRASKGKYTGIHTLKEKQSWPDKGKKWRDKGVAFQKKEMAHAKVG